MENGKQAHKIDCVRGYEGGIGQGAFFRVRLGYLKEMKVAIKCFVMTGDDNEIKRTAIGVLSEFNLQRLTRHKNILEALEITEWNIGMAIITEHSPSGNLWQLLSAYTRTEQVEIMIDGKSHPSLRIFHKYPINYHLRLRMACDVTNGLAHLHALQRRSHVIHGDLKCDNVMLTQNLRCKIGDFGSAFFFNSEDRLVGGCPRFNFTWSYCAPEKLRSFLQNLSREEHFVPSPCRKTDVYSLGMIFYSILLRLAPFASWDREKVTKAVLKGDRPDTTALELLLDEEHSDHDAIHVMSDEMRTCWSQNPIGRPLCPQILRSLQDVLEKEDVRLIDEIVLSILEIMKENDSKDAETIPLDRFCPDTKEFLPDEPSTYKRFRLYLGRTRKHLKYLWNCNHWIQDEIQIWLEALPFVSFFLVFLQNKFGRK